MSLVQIPGLFVIIQGSLKSRNENYTARGFPFYGIEAKGGKDHGGAECSLIASGSRGARINVFPHYLGEGAAEGL